jgi:hypothetical protein
MCVSTNRTNAQSEFRISVLMPFSAKEILSNPNHPNAQLGQMSREYYQGMLIALDSLGMKEKKKIILQVYDTSNDSATTAKILLKPAFQSSDLIFGPVMLGGNKMVSEFAKSKKIYQVSPLMTFSKSKFDDAYWISANPDLPSYANIIYEHIIQQKKTDSIFIFVIGDKSILDKSISPGFKALAKDAKTCKIKILDYNWGLEINQYLSPKWPNHVIIASNKEQNCNNLLYKIKDTTTTNITTYGFNQWFDYKTIDIETWKRKNLKIVSPFFIEYQDTQVQLFVMQYRERFGTEPSEEAYKGYDQARYFIGLLLQNGKSLFNENKPNVTKMLHNTFDFKKDTKTNQFKSTRLNIIKFENDQMTLDH